MSDPLVIVNARPDFATGGTLSYIDHVGCVALALGMQPVVVKFHGKTERKERKAAALQFPYLNMSRRAVVENYLKAGHQVLIPMVDNRKKSRVINGLMEEYFIRYEGAHLVVQSPHHITDFTARGYYLEQFRGKIITIGHTLNALLGKAGVVIPQPYLFKNEKLTNRKSGVAICPALVMAYKHPDIVLEANRELADNLKIPMTGRLDRIYAYHQLREKYPETEKIFFGQGRYKSHLGFKSGVEQCLPYLLCVNLTTFDKDGGRVEYLNMEAWDAGAVPVIHKDWNQPHFLDNEMVPVEEDMSNLDVANCIAIETPDELVRWVRKTNKDANDGNLDWQKRLVANGRKLLNDVHSIEAVLPHFQNLIDNPKAREKAAPGGNRWNIVKERRSRRQMNDD